MTSDQRHQHSSTTHEALLQDHERPSTNHEIERLRAYGPAGTGDEEWSRPKTRGVEARRHSGVDTSRLTGADCVLHLDPWWNPAVEDQATDRTHRIGQERPVTVIRLIAEGTIEEAVLGLHEQKGNLARGVLEGAKAAGSLGTRELVELIRSAGEETSDPIDLDDLLERSEDALEAEVASDSLSESTARHYVRVLHRVFEHAREQAQLPFSLSACFTGYSDAITSGKTKAPKSGRTFVPVVQRRLEGLVSDCGVEPAVPGPGRAWSYR